MGTVPWALIQHEGKDKTGKNVEALSFTRKSKLCSRHFDKEQISTEGYTTGDPVDFAWNNSVYFHSTLLM